MNTKVLMGVGGLIAVAVGFAAVTAQFVQADKGGKPKDVTICHRNDAVTNRYVRNSVDVKAIKGGDQSSHSHHEGLVASSEAFAQELKSQGKFWGDIIPPFHNDGTLTGYPSYNWDTVGQAVWHNGCDTPKTASASVSKTPATCEAGEKLVYGNIVNATFEGTPNGTTGPASYDVVATAQPDSLFANLLSKMSFTGDLAGRIPAQSTDPSAPCYSAPALLEATASISTTPATCEVGERLIYGDIENATISGTADGTYGPVNYTVTATANMGAAFAGGTMIKRFEGTLADKLPADSEQCYTAPEVVLAEANITIEPATCDAAEKLVYGKIENATFGGDEDGVFGPRDYSVIATANDGAAFADGKATLEFTGKLADKLSAESEQCKAPETPEVPETPENPGTPETPEVPENPEAPAIPETPKAPIVPGRGAVTPTPEAPVAEQAIEQLPNTSGSSTPVVTAGAVAVASFILALTAAIKVRFTSNL